jgi:hypothetical protein
MKLYTDLNIPLWRWEAVGSGTQLKYLRKGRPFMFFWQKKKYLKAYLDILYQIPEIDTTLHKSWALFLIQLKKWIVYQEMNAWKKLFGKKQEAIQTYKMNRAFDDYLRVLQETHSNFEFTIHELDKDYKNKWQYKDENGDILPIPKQLVKKEKLQFFFADEYLKLVTDFVKDGMKMDYAPILLSKEFYSRFIVPREIQLNNLLKINDRLFKHYRDINQIERWYSIRGDFFSLYKMSFEVKGSDNLIEQVIKLRKINGQAIPLRGVNAVTLDEFLKQVKVAKESQKDGE